MFVKPDRPGHMQRMQRLASVGRRKQETNKKRHREKKNIHGEGERGIASSAKARNLAVKWHRIKPQIYADIPTHRLGTVLLSSLSS